MANGTAKRRVTFAVSAPEAHEVFLCGTFNDWNPTKTPLKPDGRGIWKTQVPLVPGTYEYRLCIDGEWVNDPSADGYVPNPFGTTNSVRAVGTAA